MLSGHLLFYAFLSKLSSFISLLCELELNDYRWNLIWTKLNWKKLNWNWNWNWKEHELKEILNWNTNWKIILLKEIELELNKTKCNQSELKEWNWPQPWLLPSERSMLMLVSGTKPGLIENPPSPMYIGFATCYGRRGYFKGMIDEVRQTNVLQCTLCDCTITSYHVTSMYVMSLCVH